ncbi:MAG: nucleotidyltransferase [Bacteroidota bacterium]|jgi:hypothetical protein|nr:nucleotidyltransferase [Bacteroidota bacterium]
MRRKNKHLLTGFAIGTFALIVADLIIQWCEQKKKGSSLTWDNYNGWQAIEKGLIGGLIGGGVGYIIYKYKLTEEDKLPFSSDEYLKRILTEESFKSDPVLLQKVLNFRETIKRSLVDIYGDKLVSPPENTGSFHKKTAINSNYDLDIVLPFKKNGYDSLELMYNDVYDKLGAKYSSIGKVSKQTRAIGLSFNYDDIDINFDIVPGREIENYKEDKNLNLYVRPDWAWQKGSSFKTNIGIQKKLAVNKPEARKIIKLFKAYRDRNNFPLPTIIIDQLVIEAYEKSNFSWNYSITDNLLFTMEYVAKKMRVEQLLDYANSNNNLSNKITQQQRDYIANQLAKDIMNIEKNPKFIKEIFEL